MRVPKNGWSKDQKHFNGKPIAHWERLSDELVISQLLKSANLDRHSLHGQMANERLLNLARAINPTVMVELLTERERCQAGFASIMNDVMGSPEPAIKQAVKAVFPGAKKPRRKNG